MDTDMSDNGITQGYLFVILLLFNLLNEDIPFYFIEDQDNLTYYFYSTIFPNIKNQI